MTIADVPLDSSTYRNLNVVAVGAAVQRDNVLAGTNAEDVVMRWMKMFQLILSDQHLSTPTPSRGEFVKVKSHRGIVT